MTSASPSAAPAPTPGGRTRGLRPALLLMAVIGLALPWRYNLQYLMEGGSLMPAPFLAAVTANAMTTAITIDVYLAAAAFCLSVAADRQGGRSRWWALPTTVAIGLSFALPAYLFWRTRPTKPPI